MPVTHNFISMRPPSSDPGKVGSVEWNEQHNVIIRNDDVAVDAGIVESKLSLNNPTHAEVTLGTPNNGLSLVGQELSISLASGSTVGVLSAADWSTFNSKQDAIGYIPVNKAGDEDIGPLRIGSLLHANAEFSVRANRVMVDANADFLAYIRNDASNPAAHATIVTDVAHTSAASGLLMQQGGVTKWGLFAYGADLVVQDAVASYARPIKISTGAGTDYFIISSSGLAVGGTDLTVNKTTHVVSVGTSISLPASGLLMNAQMYNLTGGGTLALGGYTLTIPATGTAALLGTQNAFTKAQSIITTYTDTSGDISQVSSSVILNPTGTSSQTGRAGLFQVETTGSYNFTGFVYGVGGFVTHSGSGVLDEAYGLNYTVRNSGTGTITYQTGIYVSVDSAVGATTTESTGILINEYHSGSVGVNYGLKISDFDGGSENYAIYTGLGTVYLGDLLVARNAVSVYGPVVSGLQTALTLRAGATGQSGPQLAFHNRYTTAEPYPNWQLGTIGTIYNSTDGGWAGNMIFTVNDGNGETSPVTVLTLHPTYAAMAVGIQPASIADSSAINGTLYYSTDSGEIVYKTSGGAISRMAYLAEANTFTATQTIKLANPTDSHLIIGDIDTAALEITAPNIETPDYGNTGGTGDRTSIITISSTLNIGAGSAADWINGSFASEAWLNTEDVTGLEIKFVFPNKVTITEALYYQSIAASTMGTWKWQYDVDNDGTWVDIGSSFTWGGASPQTMTELAGHNVPALAYRMLGISGNDNQNGWGTPREFEFKIANEGGTPATISSDTGIFIADIIYLDAVKSGATQAGAGAAAGEVWATSGHATLPDNILMIGV